MRSARSVAVPRQRRPCQARITTISLAPNCFRSSPFAVQRVYLATPSARSSVAKCGYLSVATRKQMEAPPLERKLVAILAADVAGYSRLMGIDEEGLSPCFR